MSDDPAARAPTRRAGHQLHVLPYALQQVSGAHMPLRAGNQIPILAAISSKPWRAASRVVACWLMGAPEPESPRLVEVQPLGWVLEAGEKRAVVPPEPSPSRPKVAERTSKKRDAAPDVDDKIPF